LHNGDAAEASNAIASPVGQAAAADTASAAAGALRYDSNDDDDGRFLRWTITTSLQRRRRCSPCADQPVPRRTQLDCNYVKEHRG